MAKQVTAWETKDGNLFRTEEDARHHEMYNLNVSLDKSTEEKWDENYDVILGKIAEHYKEAGMVFNKQSIDPFFDWWNCKEKKNPVGKCIYEPSLIKHFGEESCIFCGEPEERK